jgi:hypothetical protein
MAAKPYEPGRIYRSRSARPRMSARDWGIAIAIGFPSALLVTLAEAIKLFG